MALSLTPSTTITLPDGTVAEFALLVLPESDWDLDENGEDPSRWSSPADRAILAAQRDGWLPAGDGFVSELDATAMTFWREVRA